MKWTDKLSGEPWYRMHTPRWAIAPTSGAGAAKHGGRFNRVGVSALYLSSETDTAIAEYQQDQLLMPPGTLVTYELELGPVVNLWEGYEHGGRGMRSGKTGTVHGASWCSQGRSRRAG